MLILLLSEIGLAVYIYVEKDKVRQKIGLGKTIGSLSKDDANDNDDGRKQWSDWLNEEK